MNIPIRAGGFIITVWKTIDLTAKFRHQAYGIISKALTTGKNNVCEGFHSKANKMLRSKPHLFRFVTLIQECEYESKTTVNQSLTCQLKDS